MLKELKEHFYEYLLLTYKDEFVYKIPKEYFILSENYSQP